MAMTTASLIAAGSALSVLLALFIGWRTRVDTRLPRILMYHMIREPVPGSRYNGLRVSPAMFERQLRWLTRHGWRGYTVSELVDQGERLPRKAFAVTFDDGYADTLLNALPLLQRYGVKATLYLVVDRFDNDWSARRKPRRTDGELMDEPKLSDAQVRELLASGLFELGAHTLSHPDLTKLDSYAAADEIRESRHRLEDTFAVPVKSFAYPFGLYDARHVLQVMQTGFTSAVTADEGIDDPADWHPLRLRRVKVGGRDGWHLFRRVLRTGRRGWA